MALRIAFDEGHSESWSADSDTARRIQPEHPENSSYASAADELRNWEHKVGTVSEHLSANVLGDIDVLVIPHPCDPKWEATTAIGSPTFGFDEIDALVTWVREGGSVFMLTEYEHEKYGSNLNVIAGRFGFQFTNTTISDRDSAEGGNPTWIRAKPRTADLGAIASDVDEVCFYRTGGLLLLGTAKHALRWRTPPTARPEGADLLVAVEYGKGRVVAVADTDLFGDEFFEQYDHACLWVNLIHWLGMAATRRGRVVPAAPRDDAEMEAVFFITDEIRRVQLDDGSVAEEYHAFAERLTDELRPPLHAIAERMPHESRYVDAIVRDMCQWKDAGFPAPDFSYSLSEFNPQLWRAHGREVFSLFPQNTPNAYDYQRFEALHFRIIWPEWLEQYNSDGRGPAGPPKNDAFVAAELVQYSSGYASECAVLFPSIVAISDQSAPSHFGIIFCSREARRFQVFVAEALEETRACMSPNIAYLLADDVLAQETFAVWDLVHDKQHFLGYLRLDEFLENVKQPYWMGACEELRVDLRAFERAAMLFESKFRRARFVCYAIILDRIIRFPIARERVRDYDGLAGQVMFAKLHRSGAVAYLDGSLLVNWHAVRVAMAELQAELENVYRIGQNLDRIGFWTDLYRFVEQYVRPSAASEWQRRLRKFGTVQETDELNAISLQLPDEFPLGQFHRRLREKVAGRVAARSRTW